MRQGMWKSLTHLHFNIMVNSTINKPPSVNVFDELVTPANGNHAANGRIEYSNGNARKAAALQYLTGYKWPVMPISRAGDKKPCIKWKSLQTELPTQADLSRWFDKQFSDANVGIITGELSGVFVIEADTKPALDWLTAQELPECPIAQSSQEFKRHFYFKHPGFRVANSQSDIHEGIDVRGDGGYIVAPPSVHHTGAVYRWIVSPDECPIPDAPEWLLDVIVEKSKPTRDPDTAAVVPIAKNAPDAHRLQKYATAALNDETKIVANAPDGKKREQLRNSAIKLGTLVPHGLLSDSEITDHLFTAIVARAKDKQLALDTIDAGIKYGCNFPRNLPAPQHNTAKITSTQHKISDDTAPDEARKTQADALFEIAQRETKVFRNEKEESFATVLRDGGAFTYPLNSTAFRSWLSVRYSEVEGKVASNSGAVQAVITTLHGLAMREEAVEVFVRVAGSESAVYYDLGDKTGRAVEITENGWQIIKASPVPFLRPKGLLPQVEPQRGGDLSALRELVNLGDESDFILYVSWLIAFFRPFGPPPHLGLTGEQGTGKTSTTVNSRRLLDPNAASTRKEPKEPRDLAVAAKNNAMIAYDNLSHLPQWLSDFICCLSTGAGFATRANYTDDEEAIFAMRRPVVFNAINEVATRPDLLDRSILLELPLLCPTKRKQEREQEQTYQQHAPLILGALFDAVAIGLRNLPKTQLATLPRMADFATWAAACAPSFGWTPEQFLAAYTNNREYSQNVATDLSTLATTIEEWADGKSGEFFKGTPQQLIEELNRRASIDVKNARDWPKDAKAMGRELKRLAPALRAHGINAKDERSNGKRSWKITKDSAVSSTSNGTANGTNGTNGTANGTVFLSDSRSQVQNSAVSADKSPALSPLLNFEKREEREEERKDGTFNGTNGTERGEV